MSETVRIGKSSRLVSFRRHDATARTSRRYMQRETSCHGWRHFGHFWLLLVTFGYFRNRKNGTGPEKIRGFVLKIEESGRVPVQKSPTLYRGESFLPGEPGFLVFRWGNGWVLV